MLELFVNGPPGAGKTSLCKLLCEEFNLALVSTGDLLRENILQRTELGRMAKECISAKSLVPDHVVVDMVAEKILECTMKRQGWVLDGFPRTVDQSAALRRKQIYPSVVLILELSESECVKRITGRRFDPITSKIYHMPTIMPRDPSVLTRLTKRSDDAADKLPPRMEAYRQYGERTNNLFENVSHRVNVSNKSPEQVLESVMALLHSIRPTTASSDSTTINPREKIQGNQSMLLPLPIVTRPIVSQPLPTFKRTSMPQKIEEAENEQDDVDEDPFQYNLEEDKPSSIEPQMIQPRTSAPSSVSSSYDEDHDTRLQSLTHTGLNEKAMENAAQPETVNLMFSNNESITQVPLSRPSLCPPKASTSHYTEMDFAKFKDMLLDGFEVLKHGRRGNPHSRTIFTDMDMKRIFWIKPTKEPKGKKARLDQSLVLGDVIQVVRGMKTDVLKRSGDVSKYERYLSLVAEDRTLDLELPTDPLCEFLVYGFEQLLHR